MQTEQQRLAQEHQEAERLLAEQRALIAELESIRDGEQQLAPATTVDDCETGGCGIATIDAQSAVS